MSDSSGKYSFKFSVPNNSAFKGYKFYNQYGVSDPAANPMGLALSNGGAGVIN